MPIPIITDQVDQYFEPIYISGVKKKMNAKIKNNKGSDKEALVLVVLLTLVFLRASIYTPRVI